MEEWQKIRHRFYQKAYYYRHHDESKDKNRKKREANKEYFLSKGKEWVEKNRERANEHARRSDNKTRYHLNESYLRKQLINKGFSNDDIDKELINLQKIIIKIKRHGNNQNNCKQREDLNQGIV